MRTSLAIALVLALGGAASAEKPVLGYLDDEAPTNPPPPAAPQTRPMYELMVPGMTLAIASFVAPMIEAAVNDGFPVLGLIPVAGPIFASSYYPLMVTYMVAKVAGVIMTVAGTAKRVPILPVTVGVGPERGGGSLFAGVRF